MADHKPRWLGLVSYELTPTAPFLCHLRGSSLYFGIHIGDHLLDNLGRDVVHVDVEPCDVFVIAPSLFGVLRTVLQQQGLAQPLQKKRQLLQLLHRDGPFSPSWKYALQRSRDPARAATSLTWALSGLPRHA